MGPRARVYAHAMQIPRPRCDRSRGRLVERILSVQIHGIVMSVAWGLLIPAGVLVSRYGKSWSLWFHAHRAIQVRLRGMRLTNRVPLVEAE